MYEICMSMSMSTVIGVFDHGIALYRSVGIWDMGVHALAFGFHNLNIL